MEGKLRPKLFQATLQGINETLMTHLRYCKGIIYLVSTQNLLKYLHFLPPDTCTYICVSGRKKCKFFRKICGGTENDPQVMHNKFELFSFIMWGCCCYNCHIYQVTIHLDHQSCHFMAIDQSPSSLIPQSSCIAILLSLT